MALAKNATTINARIKACLCMLYYFRIYLYFQHYIYVYTKRKLQTIRYGRALSCYITTSLFQIGNLRLRAAVAAVASYLYLLVQSCAQWGALLCPFAVWISDAESVQQYYQPI